MSYVSLKNVKKRVLRLKNTVGSGITSINSATKKIISGVNSLLNNLMDDAELRDSFYDNSLLESVNTASLSGILSDTYSNIPSDYSSASSAAYARGFAEIMPSAISGISAAFAASANAYGASVSGADTPTTVTYNSPNYNFYSSGLTVSQQLEQARLTNLVDTLRS